MEAIRLALALAARNPGIVDLLVTGDGSSAGGGSSSGGENARLALRRGVALALRASLANPAAIDHLDDALNAGGCCFVAHASTNPVLPALLPSRSN